MICDRDGAPLIDVPHHTRTEDLDIGVRDSFEIDFDDDDDIFAPPDRERTRAATPQALTPSAPMYSSQASWGPPRHSTGRTGKSKRAPPRGTDPAEMIDRVLGSYRLLQVIGRGGMGTVYRAEHVKLGRDVALKLLRADYAQRRDAVQRFFQEARAVNRIRHRNIVDVTDFVELDGGTTFIIMELLEGHSLSKLMRTPGALDAPRALNILIQICDGLAAAHDVRIVHRDLKPDNVIITQTSDGADLVKLLDFGVAKLLQADEEVGLKTAAGSVIGTPAFMSPEQAGGLQVDARSDLYSIGAIMYEMFTGQPVFKARSFGEYVRRHLNETPLPPRQTPRGGNVHPRLETIIMQCLEKSPTKRYQAARDLKFDIQTVLGALETMLEGDMTEISASPPAPQSSARAFQVVDALEEPPTRPVTPRAPSASSQDLHLTDGGSALPVSHVQDSDVRVLGVYGGTPMPTAQGTPFPPEAADLTDTAPSGDRMQPVPVGPTPSPRSRPFPQPTPSQPYGMDTDMVAGDLPRDHTQSRSAMRIPLLLATTLILGGAVAMAVYFSLRDDGEPSAAADTPTTTPPSNRGSGADETKPDDDTTGPVVSPIVKPMGTNTPPLVAVRFNAQPNADVFVYGETSPVCTTPCEHSIDPTDGGSPSRRDFVLRKVGYEDAVVSINLRDPPKAVDISLKRQEIRSLPSTGDPKKRDDRSRSKLKKDRRDPKTKKDPKSDGGGKKTGGKKTGGKKKKDISLEDTVDPFKNKR